MGTIFFNFRAVSQQLLFSNEICDDSIRDAPANEIELGNGGNQTLEFDALRSTERVEKLFTVPVKARLVCHVYSKHLTVRGCISNLLRL